MTGPDFTDTLSSALWLAGRGFAVHPLDHPKLERCAGVRTKEHDPASCQERGKHPATKWSSAATTDPEVIVSWFAGSHRNVGVACKSSALLVVDEDQLGGFGRYAQSVGQTIPATFTVRTGKGRHYYFARPDGRDLGNGRGALAGFGMDVRGTAGHGGYVVAPGSLHATGAWYEPDDAAAVVAAAPDWLVDALSQQKSAPGNVDWSQWEDKPRGLDAVPKVIRGPRADSGGDRHDVLVRYACSLRARDVPMAEAEQLMRIVWSRCEQPPACTSACTWDDALAKLSDVYGRYQPNRPRTDDPVADDAAVDADDPLAGLDIITASDVELRRVVYAWEGRIPRGAMTLMPGEEGIGKTTVGIRIMADLTRGTLPGEHHGTPRDVLVLATEDGLGDVVVPRLHEAGADLARVHIVRARIAIDGGSHEIIVPRDLPVLAHAVRRWDAAVVWIDSLVTTLPDELKSISYKDTAKVLKALGSWAETERVAVVAPWHLNKAAGSDTAIRIMDSRAFRTAIRSMLLVVADPDAPEGGPPQGLVALDKSNAGTLAVPALRYRIRPAHYVVQEVDEDTGQVREMPASCGVVEWLGQVEGDGRELARSYLAPRIEKEDEPGGWLRGYLDEHGETLRADVIKAATEAGFSLEQMKRAARRLPVHSREETGREGGRPFRRAMWSAVKSVHKSVPTHESAPTAPTGEGSHTPTTTTTYAGQGKSVRSVRSVRGAPTGEDGAPTWEDGAPTGEILGSCVRCFSPTLRYGDDGSPLCHQCAHILAAERRDVETASRA